MIQPAISIIVAYDKNRTIGFENKLPWFLPEDLDFFKQTTTNNIVIMGRNTWLSLGKPLPGRFNIVVSPSIVESYTILHDNQCFLPKDVTLLAIENDDRYCVVAGNVVFTPSLESAIDFLEDDYPDKKVFIIGGEQLYKYALRIGIVDKVIATEIDDIYFGNTGFPRLPDAPYYRHIPEHKWKEKTIAQSKNPLPTKGSVSWTRKVFTKIKI